MSTKQLNNKKENQFIAREGNHNLMSAIFFIFVFIVSIILIITSSLLEPVSICVLVPSVMIMIFSIFKIGIQIRRIVTFNKLIKTVEDDDSLSFYISKTWYKKREATIWFSIIMTIIIAVPIIPALIFQTNLIFDIVVLFVLMIIIFITAYLNLQTIEGYLKLSARKMDLNSTEWLQLKKETKIFYRLVFVYFLSIVLVLPLILLIIPGYRNWIYNIVKN